MKQHTKQLVEQAMTGDEAAFGGLCECVSQEVLYLCIRLTGDYHTGQDAAQEVLLHLHANITRLRNADAFYAWLNRCVAGTCARLATREKRLRGTPLQDVEGDLIENNAEFLPSDWAEHEERRRLVLAAISLLPARQQHILYMFYYQNLSLNEIAQVLKTSQSAANMALYRARKALRRRIEKAGGQALYEEPLDGIGNASASALGIILRRDAQGLAGKDAVGGLLAAISTAVAGGSGVALQTASGGVGILLALGGNALALLGVVATALFLLAGSPSPLSFGAQSQPSAVPQQAVAASVAEERAGDESTPAPSAGPDAGHGQPVDSAPPTEAPQEEADGGTAETQLRVSGRVALWAAGAEVANSGRFAQGYVVELYAGGHLLASGTVAADGRYSLNLAVAGASAEYTVQLRRTSQLQCTFAGGAASADLTFTSAGGQVALPTVYLEDSVPPTGFVAFEDALGQDTNGSSVNPARASLSAQDATDVRVGWQIRSSGGTVVCAGEGAQVDIAAQALAAGAQGTAYTLVYTVVDLGGNTATIQRGFWLYSG